MNFTVNQVLALDRINQGRDAGGLCAIKSLSALNDHIVFLHNNLPPPTWSFNSSPFIAVTERVPRVLLLVPPMFPSNRAVALHYEEEDLIGHQETIPTPAAIRQHHKLLSFIGNYLGRASVRDTVQQIFALVGYQSPFPFLYLMILWPRFFFILSTFLRTHNVPLLVSRSSFPLR